MTVRSRSRPNHSFASRTALPHSVLSYSLKVLPGKHFINWQQDPQSNYMARVVFPDKISEFLVEVDLVAEMSVYNPFDFFLARRRKNFRSPMSPR